MCRQATLSDVIESSAQDRPIAEAGVVFNRILLCYDGSADGRRALKRGTEFAILVGAEVHVLSILASNAISPALIAAAAERPAHCKKLNVPAAPQYAQSQFDASVPSAAIASSDELSTSWNKKDGSAVLPLDRMNHADSTETVH